MFGDILIAEDNIKHTFQRGKVKWNQMLSCSWREQHGQWWVRSEAMSSVLPWLLKSVSHQPVLFRCSREIFSDREIVYKCIKIFGNLFTIIIACYHSVTWLTNAAISHVYAHRSTSSTVFLFFAALKVTALRQFKPLSYFVLSIKKDEYKTNIIVCYIFLHFFTFHYGIFHDTI